MKLAFCCIDSFLCLGEGWYLFNMYAKHHGNIPFIHSSRSDTLQSLVRMFSTSIKLLELPML